MKPLMRFSVSHIPEINITNQYLSHFPRIMEPLPGGLFNKLAFLHPLISLTSQGSNRTPYLTLNLGHPCISVYLLLTVKTIAVLFSVFPLPVVEWIAGFVMLCSGIVVLTGFMGCIKAYF